MSNQDSLLNTRRFVPLFGVLFLTASSDNLLRSAILVLITYGGINFAGLNDTFEVNLATFLFIVPFFLFSSYAGKLADTRNKIGIVKVVKYCEFLIIGLASWGFINRDPFSIFIALFAMGVHSTFFSPIKYSILPQYLSSRSRLLLANGYVESGTYVAILIGQTVGSWNMADHRIDIVIVLLIISASISLITSYRLEAVLPMEQKVKFHWNFFKDSYHTYKEVIVNRDVKNNLHSISWFWGLGVILNTQLPVFTREYMGGDAYVFSVILALFSVSIGAGSLFCAFISKGKIHRSYVIFGALSISLLSLILILFNFDGAHAEQTLRDFSSLWQGLVNYLLIAGIGIASGFYSVTCYNELQIIAPPATLARVVAVNNILNALYMVLASIGCTLLAIFVNLWWLFVIFIIVNLIFVLWYWRNNYCHPVAI